MVHTDAKDHEADGQRLGPLLCLIDDPLSTLCAVDTGAIIHHVVVSIVERASCDVGAQQIAWAAGRGVVEGRPDHRLEQLRAAVCALRYASAQRWRGGLVTKPVRRVDNPAVPPRVVDDRLRHVTRRSVCVVGCTEAAVAHRVICSGIVEDGLARNVSVHARAPLDALGYFDRPFRRATEHEPKRARRRDPMLFRNAREPEPDGHVDQLEDWVQRSHWPRSRQVLWQRAHISQFELGRRLARKHELGESEERLEPVVVEGVELIDGGEPPRLALFGACQLVPELLHICKRGKSCTVLRIALRRRGNFWLKVLPKLGDMLS